MHGADRNACAAIVMPSQKFPYIDRVLEQAIENGSTPGVALLADARGKVVYRKAVGSAQIYPEQRPLSETTIFDVASLTKVMATTTAIMLLVRDNRLALNDRLKKYLPECPHEHITLRHLLTHCAGFPDHLPLYELAQQAAEVGADAANEIGSPAAKSLIIRHACYADLIYPPGKACKYSDLGFILLGHVIECVTGATLDRFCDEQIFQPFGMTNTFFQPVRGQQRGGDFAATERCAWRQKILCGEAHDENAYAMGGVAGHAGLFSTLDDTHRFMRKLYACYLGKDDFFPSALVEKFFTRQHLVEGSTRALGWDTPSRNLKEKASGGTLISEESVGHTGFTGTSIWLDLPRKLLIILFANRVHPSRQNQTFLNMRPKIHDTVVIAMER